jgi:segregation and condensation protein B
MLGTTRQFLDYFNLKSLDELPGLTAIRDLDVENLPLELLQQASPEEGETDEDTLP